MKLIMDLNTELHPNLFFGHCNPEFRMFSHGQVTMVSLRHSVFGMSALPRAAYLRGHAMLHRNYTPENQHDIGKSPCSIGNTSSNGGFSIVMLVFWGVIIL